MKSTKTERKAINIKYNNLSYPLFATINHVDKSIWVDCPTNNSNIIEILNKVLENAFNVKIEDGHINGKRNSYSNLNYKYIYVCKYAL